MTPKKSTAEAVTSAFVLPSRKEVTLLSVEKVYRSHGRHVAVSRQTDPSDEPRGTGAMRRLGNFRIPQPMSDLSHHNLTLRIFSPYATSIFFIADLNYSGEPITEKQIVIPF